MEFSFIFNSYLQLSMFICILDRTRSISLTRNNRHLVFPPLAGAPNKVQSGHSFKSHLFLSLLCYVASVAYFNGQLVIGLGLPMEVDVSTIVGYVAKVNYELPTNASYATDPYVHDVRSLDQATYQFDEELDPIQTDLSVSRWHIYRIIELALEGLNSGRSCLLRVICETAASPFYRSRGIASQLLHILLTPSSTPEAYLDGTDQEYHAAEEKGRENYQNCFDLFPECSESVLDYFSETEFS